MKASEIMTMGVYTVTPDVSVRDAARLMIEQGISGLPVVDAAGHVVGIVSEGPHPSVNVIVRDGVAELWGTILNEKKRDAVRELAENVPGIVGVQDHMVWVEPFSGMAFPAPGDTDAPPVGSIVR